MSRMIKVCAVSAAFFGVVFAASAASDFYPGAEATNTWFTASVSSWSTSGGARSPLTEAQGWKDIGDFGGEAYATNQTVVFETDAAEPLVYTNGTSGKIALVNVSLVVDPNASTPSLDGVGDAQAALTVVTNTSQNTLEWVGLVRGATNPQWVSLSGSTPVAGEEYDVQIALDNRTEKKIKYSVKASGAGSFSELSTNGVVWLDNPKSDATSVSAVAFAGSGTIKGDFSGVSILDDGATVALDPEHAGFDFTNGTVSAVVTLPSDNSSGSTRTATLRLVKFDGTVQNYDAVTVTSGNTIAWNLNDLTPGGVYSYSVVVKSDGVEREVKSGTFTAANWSDEWFGLHVATTNNGTFAEAEFVTDKWDVSGDANFTITDVVPGSNAVSRVDTRYSFETFIDTDSLERLDDAVGGIVAVDGGTWYAYTGVNDPENGWQQLAGGITPSAGIEYVIRAEFDFFSATHRVRYLVSSDGTSFVPLTLNGNEWIALPAHATTSLTSVGMSGKGYVKSISATVADKSVAQAGGTKYATIWDAVRAIANGGTVTLLTNATLKPTGALSKKSFTITNGGFQLKVDESDLGKWRLIDNGDGSFTLMKPGATYIFF